MSHRGDALSVARVSPLPHAAMLLQPASAPNRLSLVGSSPLFAELTEATRAAIAESIRDVDLAEGESPFSDDDRIDALYIVRDGSLRAVERGPNGDTLVRTIVAGELLDQLQTLSGGVRPVRVVAQERSHLGVIPGDVIDSLVATHADLRRSGEPRAASVRAVRDSVVVGVTSQAFDALVSKRPHMLRHVTRHIVEQHRRPTVASATSGRVATIAIVALGNGVSMPEFMAHLTSRLSDLGSVTRLSSATVNDRMARSTSGAARMDSVATSCRRIAWFCVAPERV